MTLNRYLPTVPMSAYEFAIKAKLAKRTIQKILDKDTGKYGFSQYVVERVRKASGGKVRYEDFPRVPGV